MIRFWLTRRPKVKKEAAVNIILGLTGEFFQRNEDATEVIKFLNGKPKTLMAIREALKGTNVNRAVKRLEETGLVYSIKHSENGVTLKRVIPNISFEEIKPQLPLIWGGDKKEAEQ